MTGKQIIIDYENLCENYSKEVGCYNTFDGSCIKEQCFTYRLLQLLKAKEQECEALQMSENEAGEIIAELKAENDTLRQFLSKEPLALQALQSAYSSYKKSVDVFYEMVKQYKQTLTEIKEIAKNAYDEFGNDVYGTNLKQILQKISECEVENEK